MCFTSVSFRTMDVSRCVLITVGQGIWKSVVQYLSERKTGYNWIVKRAKDSKRQEVKIFVWWTGKAAFFATALQTYLRRLRRKSHAECLEVSKAVKTKSVLRRLAGPTETYHWDGGFVGYELMEYLKLGFSELRESSRRAKTVGQRGDDLPPPPLPPLPPSPPPPPPSPSPSPVKLSENQVNGLLLKLLARTTFGVAGVCKSVTRVSDELRVLSEAFRDEMTNINSKMDKLAEQLYHKLYDPMFDGDCKCEKCK